MTRVQHRRWARAVDAFVDGELPAAGRAAMLEHVRVCPECGPHAALLLAVRSALVRSATRLPPPPPAVRIRLGSYGLGEGWGEQPG